MDLRTVDEAPGAPPGTQEVPVHDVAVALRRLIMSGQHFRELRAKELQLGSSDLTALGHLYHEGAMPPGKLASLMEITSGTMTALLDRGERAGFLRREPNPEDRRGLLVSLTPAGTHAMQWIYEQFETVIHEALDDVPGLAVGQFRGALDLLSDALCAGADASQDSDRGPGAGVGRRRVPAGRVS